MTTQYNVVTYGSLTNTSGVLNGFSSNNYATIPLNFNPVQRPFEVVFKFAGTNGVIWNVGDVTTARGHIEFEIYQSKLYAEFAANEVLLWSIEGVTTLSPNTNYWVKLTYNGVDTYGLHLSTDGTTWNTEGTATSSDFLGDGSTEYNLIGVQMSGGAVGYAFNGSIDLNGSYINIDNIRWWQGATTVSNVLTKIQLRHDTAANWTSVNPILLEGEVGIETDTRKQKFGDGVTAWNSLPYDKGSTALQSITSSDVTTALGYTPVNKAGDTMTGILQIRRESGNDFLQMYPNVSLTTPPASTRNLAMLVNYDINSNAMAKVLQVLYSDGGNSIKFSAFRPNNSGEVAAFEVGWDANGKRYCTFPNTTCCDGQWVNCFVQLTTTTAIGDYQIDLTNYLPNDGYKYEVMISGQVSNTNSTYGSVYLNNAHGNNGEHFAARVGTNCRTNCINCTLPVDSGRSIYMKITDHAVAWETHDNWTGLYLVGYRRIGSNS